MDDKATSPDAGTDVPGMPRRRAINVEVPEEVYWHVRECATQSHLPMKDFMAKFCREARSYPPDENAGPITV
jgi:hypothetical protein